jgi:Family of unknown function (DUF5926)/SEC-C motif
MGKKSRLKTRSEAPTTPGEVGPRQPCPCGSGKRYKACHGDPSGAATTFVSRPFEGLASECDLIALRELVPAATAPLPLVESVQTDRAVKLCTLLPMATPAMVREDGTVWLALQVQHQFGDPSRDLAAVLERALEAEPGEAVGLTEPPGQGRRLQDMVETDRPLEITVHDSFEFWIADMDDDTGALRASLESANAAANPTRRLSSVEAAYWTDVGTKEHLRWVMPHDEERLLSALARLHVRGADVIAEGARLVGMFRVHGVLVPVWDLPVGTGADVLEEPAAAFAEELDLALGDDAPLTSEERAARSGLANRQLTIR